MEDLVEIIEALEKRIELLERLVSLREITIPAGGKIVVNNETSDPTGENGQIIYNTTSNKFRVYENGAWRDMG